MPKLSPEILERAERAREDFPTFVDLVWKFTPLKHQVKWLKELKRVVDGELIELLIVAPRGAGKSALFVLFLAWMIGTGHESPSPSSDPTPRTCTPLSQPRAQLRVSFPLA